MSRRQLSRQWLWMLIASAVLCQMALNLARPLISYKVLALGGDSVTVGLTSAAYALLPVAAALWLGRVSDRRSSLRGIVVIGTVLLAAGPFVLFLSPSLFLVGAASAVLGLGHLCFTIAGQSAIARFVPLNHMDAAFGWFTASFSVGQMAGPLLAGLAMGSAEGVPAGARLADANTGLLIAGVISLLAVPFAAGTAVRGSAKPVKDPDAPAPAPPVSAAALLRFPAVRTNMVASLALLATTDILVAFLPLLGEEKGVAPVMVGILLALRAAASITSRLLLPVLLARWSRPTLVIASLAGAGTTLALLPWLFEFPWLAGGLLVIGGFFLGLGQPITMTLVTHAVPPASRGAALALRLLGNRVGQVSLPAAAGLLAAPVGPSGALWMSCVVLGAACIRPRPTADGGD
ncbi:MFS transporter [Arthrobacter sp. ISL-72]|uniref:MFS transporter n=1 Tax=Arthrobacter sp. ISL-72 TaxID=2819114 RepID=UPI0020355B6F|nr:MFS transporter [Arthrobacter sp. ISL-72]